MLKRNGGARFVSNEFDSLQNFLLRWIDFQDFPVSLFTDMNGSSMKFANDLSREPGLDF